MEDLNPSDPADDVDTKKLETYAKKLRNLGIENYAKRAYGGEKAESVNLQALKYQYFLYQAVDLPGMTENSAQMVAMKEDLREQLEA